MKYKNSGQIGKVIRDGMVFDGKNWMGNNKKFEPIKQSVQELFNLLDERKIRYVLVGGIALLHYIDGRNTQDMDLIMSMESLERLPELEIVTKDMYFVKTEYGELTIDILLTGNPLFKEIRDRYSQVQELMDRKIPMATVEGLLLLKLYALPSLYRQGDFSRVGIYENDIAVLLHDYRVNMDSLLTRLDSYLGETDLDEIKRILGEIQDRIDRFNAHA